MKISLMPKTKRGQHSVWLMVATIVLFVLGSVLPWKEGYSGIAILIQNPWQGIITLLMFAAGSTAAVMAIKAIMRDKERALLVLLAILLGLYAVLGFIGSIITLFFS